MDCNTLEYQGNIYTRAEIGQMIKDGKIVTPIDESVAHDIHIPSEFPRMPFKFSVGKIVEGKKFLTVRPGDYKMGTYQLNGEKYNIYPEGKHFLDYYLEDNFPNMTPEAAKAKFIKDFIGEEEVQYKHIKEFLNNQRELNIYRIEKVTSKEDIIPLISDPRFAKLYMAKQAQIKRLRSQLNAEKNPTRKEELQARLDNIKGQAGNIVNEDTRTFGMLLGLMKSDLATVKRILDSQTDKKSLDFAKSLINNYVDMLNREFQDDVSALPEAEHTNILAFIQDATNTMERLTKQYNMLANEEQKRLTGRDVVKVNGLPVDVHDVNTAVAWSYDSRWNKNPIVQALTKTIRDTQVVINQGMVEFRHMNNKLVKALKSAGHNFDFMTQVNKDGNKTGYVVHRESHDYIEAKKAASANITIKMIFYAQNHNFTIDDPTWIHKNSRVMQYARDNNWIVDDGSPGKTYEQKVEEYAQRVSDRVNPYSFKALMDKIKLHPGRITQVDREFFTQFLEYGGMSPEYIGGNWAHTIEMQADSKWIDPKYQAIQNMASDDPRKAFYDHMVKYLKEGRRMRRDEDNYLAWNYIPEKYKSLGVLSTLKQLAHDHLAQRLSINKGSIDPETGEVEKKIPLYMVNGILSPENKSYDLGNVLEDFVKETKNYEEKSKIENSATMLLSLLKQQRVYDTNADGSVKVIDGEEQFKQGLSNNFIQASHRVAAQIYGETQDKELVTATKLFTAAEKDLMKQIKADIDALGLSNREKQIALQYTSIGADYTGNNIKIADYVKLANRFQNVVDGAHNFTGSKAVNSLMFLSSATFLGLNLFAGIGEILQGYSALFTESSGGRYFTDREAARAMGMSMNPWNRAKFDAIAQVWDTVGDIFHESEGRLKNKMESWTFAQYKLANHMTNTSFTVAMLLHEKVKDKKGIEHSVYDALSIKDGKLSWNIDTDEQLYTPEGKLSQYVIDLIHKSDEVLALNRERKTFMDPIKLDSKMVGRILGQFKKNWMIGTFYNRFGDARDTNLTGAQSFEGFYRTFGREVFSLPKVIDPITGREVTDTSLGAILGTIPRLFKYIVKFSAAGKALGFGPKEGEYDERTLANLQKFMREFSMALTISTAMLVLSSMNGGDDKDPLRTYFINQLARLHRDVLQFASPTQLASILKDPAPILSTMVDYTNLMWSATGGAVFGDPYNNKGELKAVNALENITPFVRQIKQGIGKFDRVVVYGK